MSGDPMRGLPLALATGAVLLLAAAGADTFDFMPKGGRALLLEVAGPTPAHWHEVVRQERSEDEWRQWTLQSERGQALSERQQATLAAYLALNMPSRATHPLTLPRDGRDLAWARCQACHSLYSGFLTQRGPAQRWRDIFIAPFHRHIRMSPQEREEFARYAEINVPMEREDVPADMRF